MRELVKDLGTALRSLGWPSIDALEPGLTPGQIRDHVRVSDRLDENWVDETIISWWSWHNGVRKRTSRTEPYLPVSCSPDTDLCLSSLQDAIVAFERMSSHALDLPRAFSGGDIGTPGFHEVPIFPINSTLDGSLVCLRRIAPTRPWEIWVYTNENQWNGVAREVRNGEVHFVRPTFEAYLQALNRVLASANVGVDSSSGITSFRTQRDGRWDYPWTSPGAEDIQT